MLRFTARLLKANTSISQVPVASFALQFSKRADVAKMSQEDRMKALLASWAALSPSAQRSFLTKPLGKLTTLTDYRKEGPPAKKAAKSSPKK